MIGIALTEKLADTTESASETASEIVQDAEQKSWIAQTVYDRSAGLVHVKGWKPGSGGYLYGDRISGCEMDHQADKENL